MQPPSSSLVDSFVGPPEGFLEEAGAQGALALTNQLWHPSRQTHLPVGICWETLQTPSGVLRWTGASLQELHNPWVLAQGSRALPR